MEYDATQMIYVQLLNEGLVTARPAPAKKLDNGKYYILKPEDYDPEDEEWEFVPGTIVECEYVNWGNNEEILLAVRKI